MQRGQVRLLLVLLLGLRATGQIPPPTPAPVAPPPPAVTQPQPSTPPRPDPLLVSQFVLASAGTSYAITRHSLLVEEPARTVATSIGVVGLTIALERIYTPRSKKARVWMTIANFGASVALGVLASRDIGDTRDAVRKAGAIHP